MGGEVDFFIRVRQRYMAARNILAALERDKYREMYDSMSDEDKQTIRFHALRGEYSDMMIAFDKSRLLKQLTLNELRMLGKQYVVYDWCRAGRHNLITALAKKGLK